MLFTSSKCAKACANKLHNTSKMGNIMNVFVDTLGKDKVYPQHRVLTIFILIDFLMHVDRISIELPNLYFKGSQV